MPEKRFLALPELAEELSISATQAYALVRHGDIPAIRVGGRSQWRIQRIHLEEYIERSYAETRQFITDHPLDGRRAASPPPEG